VLVVTSVCMADVCALLFVVMLSFFYTKKTVLVVCNMFVNT